MKSFWNVIVMMDNFMNPLSLGTTLTNPVYGIRSWISNYVHSFLWDVITFPYLPLPNLSGGLGWL